MDKRIEANLLVKKKITDAFFQLMEKKSISEISVSELIATAGVARSSFYRNYDSIEDVLRGYISQFIDEFTETNPVHTVDFASRAYMRHVFRFYYERRDRVMLLYHSGLSSTILKEITDYNIEAIGDMPAGSIRRYSLYYYSGALFSVVIHWLESGAKESVEDMANGFCSMVSSVTDI